MTKSTAMKIDRSHPCRMVRGDRFFDNLNRFIASSFYKIFTDSIYDQRRSLTQQEVPYRVLSHWDQQQLLECERESEKGWRKFNLVEILWLQIIQELRKFGLPLSIIQITKAYFFERYYDPEATPYLDFYLIAAMGFNKPVYMIIFPDGKSEFFEYTEYQNALTLQLLGSHINLSINEMLRKIQVSQGTNPQFPKEMPQELDKVFEFFNKEDFDSATIYKKEGEIDRVELVRKQTKDVKVAEILNQSENQDLCIKKRAGQVIHISQTKITKI